MELDVGDLLDRARVGFACLEVGPSLQEQALGNLEHWLSTPAFRSYQPSLRELVLAERWALLLDCFYRTLPFGTGGRRGAVGLGPNRFNAWTLGSSVQGHAAWLRETWGDKALKVVIAYDVRRFEDLGGIWPGSTPVHGLSSRDFAEIAAEVYAAADIEVVLPPRDEFLSTPELSFAIRHLGADAGLNISASHNHPDDNGGKVYDHTGCQVIPPHDEEMAKRVDAVDWLDRMPLDRAKAAGLISELGEEVHEAYIQANLGLARDKEARSARVVFTPLHGTAMRTVVPLLQRAGFALTVVAEQAEPDGAFSTVPHRAPNPERPGVFEVAVRQAEAVGADIVMACDPDADRIGLMARPVVVDPGSTDPFSWRFFSGNEIAALLADHVLRTRTRTAAPLVIQTEVTSSLVARVARARGARVVRHLLVGFKYIGAALDELERTGRFAGVPGGLQDFVLGAEESHGVLLTPALRDKDAAGGALLLAELASVEKAKGRTLVDRLEDLWLEVGYVHNELISTVMQGAAGRERIAAIQESLRSRPWAEVAGREVISFFDRQDEAGVFGPILSETDRASRNVLVFKLDQGARVVIRPSGTEPKTKVYVEVCGRPGVELAPEIRRVRAEARRLSREVVQAMLLRVGLELPLWALEIGDLVPTEQKVVFARELLPRIQERLKDSAGDEDHRAWLDRELLSWGPGARSLLLPGVEAFIQAREPADARALRLLFED